MDETDGSLTERDMDKTDGSLTGFGAFKVHVSKQLISSVINDLATYFEFEPALCEKVQGNGLEFVNTLVERGLITENDISKLLEALEKSGLGGKKSNIHKAFERYRKDATRDSCYTPTVSNLSCEEDCSEESNSIATEIIDLTSNSQNIEENFFRCSMCKVYVELDTDLYCSTYNNLPVCLTCANVSDAEHTTGDMKFLTAKEKVQLIEVKEHLEKCYVKYEELIKGIKNTIDSKEKIDNPAARKMEDQYKSKMVAIKDKTKEQQDLLKESKAKLKQSLKEKTASLAENKEKEIRQITEKYKKKLYKIRKDNEKERKKLDKNHKIALQKLSYDQKQTETKLETQNNIAKHDHEQKAKVLQISESVNQLAGRMYTYKTTSESIHHADDDRFTTQCLSELHIACKQLNYDFEKQSVELASVLSTKFVITIDEMKYTKQKIQSITCCGENRIAITGIESQNTSFVALIDSEGKRVQFTKTAEQNAKPRCSIAIVSDSKVVTVSEFNLLNIFNTQDWSRLLQQDISKIISCWSNSWLLSCVATDRATNKIYVGASNLNIYVFNEHLIHVETLDLSKIVTSIADIQILERDLLVCDESAKRAYIVTRQGGKSTLKQEIKNIGSDEYSPLSTCTDKDGFIFMVWSAKKQRQVDCRLAKYSPDGQTVITTRKLNNRTECITIMDQYKGKEGLVAASENSKEVVLYTVPQSTNPFTKNARSSTASMGSLGEDTTSLTPSIKGGEIKVSNQKNNGQNITDTSALRVPDLDASTSGHSSTQKPGTTQKVTTKAKAPILLQPKQQVIKFSDNHSVKRNISTKEINSEVRKQQGNKENSLDGGQSSQALKRTYPTESNRIPFSSSSARNTDVKKTKKEDATSAILNMPAQRLSVEPDNLSLSLSWNSHVNHPFSS